MMSECKFRAADGECLRERVFPYKEFCVDGPCPHYTAQTNADHIRAMTDEELAAYLSGDEAYERTHWTMIHWLDWLKQEAGE